MKLIASVRERDREKETTEKDLATAIVTHNFFSWPFHAVLSSGLYIFASSASCPGATADRCSTGRLAASLRD